MRTTVRGGTGGGSPRASLDHAIETISGRLQVLSVARIVAVLATVLVLTPLAVTDEARAGRDVLSFVSAGYLAANFVVLLLLRFAPRMSGWLLDLSLLFDAAWVAVVLWATGGASSPLLFLMYLQVVAVTVLFDWQSGAKLTIADTVAFVWMALATRETGADPLVGLVVVAIWITWGATAYFSSVNERDLRRSNQELALLRELNTELEASLDVGDVCNAIARGLVHELGYARSVVWMAHGGGELSPASTAGFDPSSQEALEELRLPVGAGPVGAAVEARAPQLVPREAERPAVLAEAFEPDSPLVVVPLVSEGRLLGLVTVEVRTPVGRAPRIRGRDVRILATLATEASLALDNARLHAELRDLSVTDALTGVYNHRYFQQRLQEELDRALRRAQDGVPEPVSLILMDLDFFKQVNDSFGHPSGDELLRSIARLATRVLRSTDVVCRYGGEEFAVVLPDTTVEQARQVAERLREAVERSDFTGADGRYLGQVTASFGVAAFTEGQPSRSVLVQQADDALYEAKRRGRNRVELHRSVDGGSADGAGSSVAGVADAVREGADPRSVELQ